MAYDVRKLEVGEKYRFKNVKRAYGFHPALRRGLEGRAFEVVAKGPLGVEIRVEEFLNLQILCNTGNSRIFDFDIVPAAPLSPQCKQLLEHLQAGHSVTQRSALNDMDIAALPRRIADLREHGYDITAVREKNHFTGRPYVRYRLNHTQTQEN